MKYLFLPICLLLPISTFAFSKTNYFYIAGNTGIFQADFNQTYLDQTDTIPQNIAQPVTQHGYIGGLAVGYRKALREIYFIGGELSGNIETQNATFKSGASTTAFSDTAKIDYHVDLTIVPGINLTETTASYLKLGISIAYISDSLTSPAGFTASNSTYNAGKYQIGFAAGIGASKSITQNTSIFTEARYHDYGTINYSNFQNFSATYSHSAHVYSYDAVVGIAYKFV